MNEGLCSFFVKVSVSQSKDSEFKGKVRISEVNLDHGMCEHGGVATSSVVDLCNDDLVVEMASTSLNLVHIVSRVKEMRNITIDRHAAGRLRKFALSRPSQVWLTSFSTINPWLMEFKQCNPDAEYVFDRNEDTKQFKAACLVFPGVGQLLDHSWEGTAAVDMGHLITPVGEGMVMCTVVVSTGEHISITIAVGLGPQEDHEFYTQRTKY
jgi:hypothetical protein